MQELPHKDPVVEEVLKSSTQVKAASNYLLKVSKVKPALQEIGPVADILYDNLSLD